MTNLLDVLISLISPTAVVGILILLLVAKSLLFKRIETKDASGSLTKGLITTFIVLFGVLAFILTLPIEKELKGQILSFLGIIISAGIALSSTTVLGNLIAGIMNNTMNRFGIGDLIKIGDLQGRVTRKSIFHTEIQLEDSNFITIPNLYIASHPVKLTRKTNTVISASVSLGYDVPRNKIEDALKNAATSIGLKDPYVYITELGDFSVVYKIHGFLADSGKFFSTTSLLNSRVMDKLHEARIEIVSPGFMNQRQVTDKEFIPITVVDDTSPIVDESPEDLIFDMAIKSEKLQSNKEILKQLEAKQEELKLKLKELKDKDPKESERINSLLQRYEKLKQRIQEKIDEQINDKKGN